MYISFVRCSEKGFRVRKGSLMLPWETLVYTQTDKLILLAQEIECRVIVYTHTAKSGNRTGAARYNTNNVDIQSPGKICNSSHVTVHSDRNSTFWHDLQNFHGICFNFSICCGKAREAGHCLPPSTDFTNAWHNTYTSFAF
jgi:hypothetical protein